MKIEPDIKNMTLTEYLEYEAKNERRLRRDVRSRSSPTRYEGVDFNSSHRDKSVTLDFQYSYEDVKINKYYTLPPLLPCFQPSQPHTKCGHEYPNENEEVDIDSMTISEYELYVAKQRVENLRKQEEAKVEECDDGDIYNIWDITVEDVEILRQILTRSVHTLPEPDHVVQPCVPLLPSPDELKVVRDEEPNNDVDSNSIQVIDNMDDVIQPSIPQTTHTTPPDKDYVAPATKSIFNELLEEFKDEILNVTVVDEEADFNPTRVEELEILLAKDPQSYFTKIQCIHLS
uniref:Uncharacterized protein n=1 Tax=Tanacetum cinerariifolium TaxID=118510 RepID=A0A6L2L6H7_TANCI|nr:hypothetical protein [Tanacetum cinerariifolium]GEV06779.1 hypothetical protein [Tanacetum cinerariifolium]GEV09352.1 hypothetical protein [Tanacetum cinerariifolium]